MKQLKPLSIPTHIFLFFLIIFVSPFKASAQSSTEVIIDSIYLNNEQVILEDEECKLDLKYNDVIKLVGRAPKNTPVSISFAQEKYSGVSDEMGNWMILFSIPYIEDGKYEIIQDGYEDSYCKITLKNLNTEMIEQNEGKINKSIYIVVLLSIVSLTFGSYIFLSKKKKHIK